MGLWLTDMHVFTRHSGLHRSRQPTLSPRGFTLFEILVVLVVIALASAITVLGFGQLAERRQDAAATDLMAWLRAAADTAVFQNMLVGVAQQDNAQELFLMAFYQDDWYRLSLEETLVLNSETRLDWSPALLGNREFPVRSESASDSPNPYLVFMPSGEIVPEGEIGIMHGENLRARIWWDDEHELQFSWQLGR